MSPARRSSRKVCLVDLLPSETLDVSVGALKVTLSLVCKEMGQMGDRVGGGDPGLWESAVTRGMSLEEC